MQKGIHLIIVVATVAFQNPRLLRIRNKAEEKRQKIREGMKSIRGSDGLKGLLDSRWPESAFENTEWRKKGSDERDLDMLVLVDEDLREVGRGRRAEETAMNLRAQGVDRGEVGFKSVSTAVPGGDGVVVTTTRFVFYAKVGGDRKQQVKELYEAALKLKAQMSRHERTEITVEVRESSWRNALECALEGSSVRAVVEKGSR